jgi:hypothetical protein
MAHNAIGVITTPFVLLCRVPAFLRFRETPSEREMMFRYSTFFDRDIDESILAKVSRMIFSNSQ